MFDGRIGSRVSIFFVVVNCLALLSRTASADSSAIFQRYGLSLVTIRPEFPVSSGGGSITGTEAPPDAVTSYLHLLEQEWNRYPVELIKRTRLKRIVICKDLAYEKQLRAAVPDLQHDTLYLDALRGRNSDIYVRNVIHHEFYHIIDLRDDGQLYKDDNWSTLNPPGFTYGTGGRNAQTDGTMSLTTTLFPGFLTKYSTTGVEEDKAETFANMMTDPAGSALRAASDPVIAAKIGMMKQLLESFCPQMNAEFWHRFVPGHSDGEVDPLFSLTSRFNRIPPFAEIWWR